MITYLVYAYAMIGLVFLIFILGSDEWKKTSEEQIEQHGKVYYMAQWLISVPLVALGWLPILSWSFYKFSKDRKNK